MKNLWVITFLLIGNYLNAQTIQSDLALLRTQQISSAFPTKEKKSVSLLTLPVEFYRNNVSGQWGHTCYFEIPCSDFNNQLMQRYGIVKGFFLAIDRYGKCNKLSFYETLPNRINTKGKIIDSVNFYSSR
jgi:putative component of membrane protein insertase Oxa1/YidC/SpoIIIJ protein YidD